MLNDDLNHFARAIVRGEEQSPSIATSYQNYQADVAVEIYRNNYRGNLHAALAGAYPVIKQLVGDDFFLFLAKRFIGQYPSRSANLHCYGAELAGFVAAFEPAKELLYLADTARLEWASHIAYFADDRNTLDISELARVAPERYPDLVLRIQQSCHLVRSRYPITAIWHAHQPGSPDDFHIDLDSGSGNALVCRMNDVVLVSELAEDEADWLQRIMTGAQLGVVTFDMLERHPDFDLQAALLKLVAQNVFASFDTGVIS